MSMNDPIADMLTRVRNANSAGKATVSMPSSKKLVEIARIMTEEGYVQGYEITPATPRDILEITLKYGDKKEKVIRGIKRISKPGLRIYAGKDELPRVRDFRGISPTSFDGRGNYTLGITEQMIFPEIEYDKVDRTRGMDITFVTTAENNTDAKALLDALGFPFKKN